MHFIEYMMEENGFENQQKNEECTDIVEITILLLHLRNTFVRINISNRHSC